MITKKSIWKIVRSMGFALVTCYAALNLFVFAYFTYQGAPIAGLYAADWLLIRGPIQRYMHPVTKDDNMIAGFNARRTEFEKLVRIHSERCMTNPWTDRPHPDVEKIMQQIGLTRVGTDQLSIWLPDPYSERAFQQARIMRHERGRKLEEAGRVGNPLVLEEAKRLQCRHGAAMFYWEKFPTDSLAKGLIHFPVEPKVADGELYRPAMLSPDKPMHSEEVLQSLDRLPTGFWRFQRSCKFRRVEAQWFVFVCPI
jgi:hypothetical protein